MENRRENDEIEIDLLEVFQILLGRIWLILGVGLFCALVCFMVSAFILVPKYESTTKIYILNKTDDASVTYSDVHCRGYGSGPGHAHCQLYPGSSQQPYTERNGY